MVRLLVAIGALATLAGCGGGVVEGTLVDGLSGQPLADTPLLAKAVGEVRLTCQNAMATTDATGKFRMDVACLGESAYKISSSNEELWFGDVDEIPQGGFGAPVDLKAWRAPEGAGVYVLKGTDLTLLRTAADVKSETIYETEEKVLYPSEIPNTVMGVAAADHLVITSKSLCDSLKFHPLIASEARRFGDKKAWVDMEAFSYIGTSFTSDTEFERVEAQLDASKVISLEKEDHAAKFIPGGALPAGRYVLMQQDARRLYMVDFGG